MTRQLVFFSPPTSLNPPTKPRKRPTEPFGRANCSVRSANCTIVHSEVFGNLA
jgi:hypothetical protein